MCLYVKNGQPAVIAENNIPCYKVLFRGNKAEHYVHFVYKKWKINDNVALVAIPESDMYPHSSCCSINEGYHSYVPGRATHDKKRHLFIIPKGAYYYIGGVNTHPHFENGYVSSTIIFVGKNNWWNRMVAKLKYGVKFE